MYNTDRLVFDFRINLNITILWLLLKCPLRSTSRIWIFTINLNLTIFCLLPKMPVTYLVAESGFFTINLIFTMLFAVDQHHIVKSRFYLLCYRKEGGKGTAIIHLLSSPACFSPRGCSAGAAAPSGPPSSLVLVRPTVAAAQIRQRRPQQLRNQPHLPPRPRLWRWRC